MEALRESGIKKLLPKVTTLKIVRQLPELGPDLGFRGGLVQIHALRGHPE